MQCHTGSQLQPDKLGLALPPSQGLVLLQGDGRAPGRCSGWELLLGLVRRSAACLVHCRCPSARPIQGLLCTWRCCTGAHLPVQGWRAQAPASSCAGGSRGECRSKGKLCGAVSCSSPGQPVREARSGSAAPGSSLTEQWQDKLKSPVSVARYL